MTLCDLGTFRTQLFNFRHQFVFHGLKIKIQLFGKLDLELVQAS